MDVPLNDAEVVPEKIEDKEDGGLTFHCSLSDTEIVHKIALEFLPGLASACVDNTTGGIFRTPGSVAVNIRNEMVEYLTKRSETFVAESVILEDPDQPEVSDHPFDIISDFTEDFALSKRNFFSRVSGWMLSEKREDKIDDFVQEMEISGFWSMDRREAVAQVLLRNVDFKNKFHCDKKFNSEEELNEHMLHCGFNSMICPNEGCNASFSASQMEKHDSICPFKIIPCEQKCPDTLMRRDMDRHCITVCGMKLANCSFYAVGCQSTVPQCMMQQHRRDDLRSHLLYILQKVHRDKSLKVLKKRIEQLEKSSFDELVKAPDVRSLTFAIKDLEADLGPFEEDTDNEYSEEGKVNEEVKIDGEGKVNEEVNITEEGKVNEKEKVSNESKVSEEGKVKEGRNNERKINEEGIIHDEGNVDQEGKIDGEKINDEKKINEEQKANEARMVSENGEVKGREVHEEGTIHDEGNINQDGKIDGGKINDEKRVKDEQKANEARTFSEGGEVKEREVHEEGIIHDEGNVNQEGKIDGGKINEEGKTNDENRVNEERKANEVGKINKGGKVGEEGKEVLDEGHVNEAGKVNQEERISEERKIDEEKTNGAKVNVKGKVNDEGKANEVGQVHKDNADEESRERMSSQTHALEKDETQV